MTRVMRMGRNGWEKIKEYDLKRGQKLIFEGPGAVRDTNWVITGIIGDQHYSIVNTETKKMATAEYIRPIAEKFGIGYYFVPGEVIDESVVAEVEKKAMELGEIEKKQREREREEASDRLRKGLELYNKLRPKWAKAVVMACEYVDESDPMTDYFYVHLKPIYLLEWSKTKRNCFREMRKAALNLKETAFYSTDIKKEDEHRENYSMGMGMYLWRPGKYAIKKYAIDLYKETVAMVLINGGDKTIPENKVRPEEVVVTINKARNGVEIRFPIKPAQRIINSLKANHFRWSRYNRCWYNKATDEAIAFANSLK